jgi:hypothetical protein
MTDSRPEGTLQALWQSQPPSERAMSIEEVREKTRRLERRVVRRNRREYIAAVVVLVGYGWILRRAPSPAVRVGAGLIIAATIFICYQLRVHGSAASLQADVGNQKLSGFLSRATRAATRAPAQRVALVPAAVRTRFPGVADWTGSCPARARVVRRRLWRAGVDRGLACTR